MQFCEYSLSCFRYRTGGNANGAPDNSYKCQLILRLEAGVLGNIDTDVSEEKSEDDKDDDVQA